MRCLDTSFMIDLFQGDEMARNVSAELDSNGESISAPAPALAEFMLGANAAGGKYLARAVEFASCIDILPVDRETAMIAARIGADLMQKGQRTGIVDVLIAAASIQNDAILVTRDKAFSNIVGLAIQYY